ncbi:MAG: hypothetical protein ACM3VT_13890 [Solirubrobacterales bacterium]
MSERRNAATNPHESGRNGADGVPPHGPAVLLYLSLLWRHRFLIAAVSIAPAVAVALLLALWPSRYTATFVYERQLAESQHSVLLQRFYSQENLDKISAHLREQGLADYALRLDKARVRQSFDKLIRFEVSPMYPKRLQTTDPCMSAQISAFQARLLYVKVLGDSESQVLKAGAVVTNNLENILPLYDIRNGLKESIQEHKRLAAKIEDNRFSQTVDLQAEQSKLLKLKGVDGIATQPAQDSIVLQFNDVKNSSEFLPLSSQVLAVQSRIIDLQESMARDTEKYGFYLKVLELNDRLLGQIEKNLLTDYTVRQFLESLGEQLQANQSETAVADYLKSYIRKTENLIQANTRAGEKPVVYPMPKGIVRNSALAFVMFLMIALFTAVLSEYRRQRRDPQSGSASPGSSP